MKSQGWFPLGLTGWISLQSKGLSGVFSCTTIQKHQFFGTHYILKHQFFGAIFIMVQYSHPWMTTGKTITLTIGNFVSKMMSLLFNMLFVMVFLPRSKYLLIPWMLSPLAVNLKPKKRKYISVYNFSPSICYELMGLTGWHDLHVFWIWVSNQLFTLIKRLFSSSSLSVFRVVLFV